MKKQGFTLVELMGVLVVIGLLSLIIIPITSNLLKKQKEEQYAQQITSIELSAKNFGSDNLVILPSEDGETMHITIGQLKGMGYINESVINTITNKEISNCAQIKITREGNNYKYEYDETTEEDNSCDLDSEEVVISDPNDGYIKKGEISSYLITINDTKREEVITKYEIVKNKISLTGNTDAIYTVVEGNGIYRVIIKAGDIEGRVNLKLESGALLKNGIEDLVGSDGMESDKAVIIDNTKPEIVFGTDGSTSYVSQASTTVTATDDSGIKSINYGWSTSSTSTTLGNETTSGSTLTSKCGGTTDGECYLYIKACDNNDNCTEKRTSAFKLDVTPPTISLLEHYSCMAGIGMYYTIEDTTSGIVKYGHIYCLNNDNDCYNSIGIDTNWSTPATIPDTTKRQYHSEWTMCVTTEAAPESGQGYKAYLIVYDAAGNIAKYKNDTIIYPYQGAGCNWCTLPTM